MSTLEWILAALAVVAGVAAAVLLYRELELMARQIRGDDDG